MAHSGMAYYATKPCGCFAGVISDDYPDVKELASQVAKWLKDGCTIDHITDEEVRQRQWTCPTHNAEKYAKQEALL